MAFKILKSSLQIASQNLKEIEYTMIKKQENQQISKFDNSQQVNLWHFYNTSE